MTPSIEQAIHQFLTLLLIWTLLPNLTYNLIARGFHRTFATGATCQQRTLTPPDTWFCPTLGLVCVLMSRPISPELVLYPDFWVSNIPRYFCFCFESPTLIFEIQRLLFEFPILLFEFPTLIFEFPILLFEFPTLIFEFRISFFEFPTLFLELQTLFSAFSYMTVQDSRYLLLFNVPSNQWRLGTINVHWK